MTVIAISNQKGGVSKTTLSFNLAHILSEEGKKVLAVDFDPQGSLTEIMEPKDVELDIFAVIDNPTLVDKSIYHINDNLDLLVGGISLSVFDMTYGQTPGRENMLKNLLSMIKDRYDFILIDCPPSLGLLLVNALNAADKIIIPAATDYLSYKGFDLLLSSIAEVKINLNEKLKILGVVATMHDGRTLHSKEVLELIADEFEILGIVGVSTKVKDATMSGKPLHHYDKTHKIAKEYISIARRVLEDE